MKITKVGVMLYAAFYSVCLKSILEEVCRGGCLQESVRRRLL